MNKQKTKSFSVCVYFDVIMFLKVSKIKRIYRQSDWEFCKALENTLTKLKVEWNDVLVFSKCLRTWVTIAPHYKVKSFQRQSSEKRFYINAYQYKKREMITKDCNARTRTFGWSDKNITPFFDSITYFTHGFTGEIFWVVFDIIEEPSSLEGH